MAGPRLHDGPKNGAVRHVAALPAAAKALQRPEQDGHNHRPHNETSTCAPVAASVGAQVAAERGADTDEDEGDEATDGEHWGRVLLITADAGRGGRFPCPLSLSRLA